MNFRGSATVALVALLSSCSGSDDPFAAAAAGIQAATGDAVRYAGSKETSAGGYVLTFTTSSPALMASPDGDKDQSAFLSNRGKALLWKQAACTQAVNVVAADLQAKTLSVVLDDEHGETQLVALCS